MCETLTTSTGKAVILGAGPAGLSAGFVLARAGWQVEVFEQAATVGGLARTVDRNGYRFDIGGHRWYTKKDWLNQFLIELMQDELIIVDRTSRIYFDGKYVDYPLRTGNVLAQIGPATSARAIADFALSKVKQQVQRKPITTMEDAYVAQFGRTLYELFFRRYSEKVWGDACSNLSGDWVAQRSRNFSLLTAARDALKLTDGKVETLLDRFMYPKLGFGRISERLAEEIERAGGTIHLGQRVVRAHHVGKAITGVTVSDGRREQIISGDAFISSIPMTELAQSLHPRADTAIVTAARQLTYRDIITVHLMLSRPSVTQDTWIYVHDPRVSFARLHEPRNWSPALAPANKTSLVLEFFCDAGDAIWQRTDDELCDLAVRDLAEYLGFIDPGDVIDAFVVRSRDAYPRYSLDYQAAVETIKAHLRSFQNLAIVGRGGTFRYNNTDHAIETGLLAAAGVLGDTVDVESVNTSPEYLEERRVPTEQRRPPPDGPLSTSARGNLG